MTRTSGSVRGACICMRLLYFQMRGIPPFEIELEPQILREASTHDKPPNELQDRRTPIRDTPLSHPSITISS